MIINIIDGYNNLHIIITTKLTHHQNNKMNMLFVTILDIIRANLF